MTLSRRRIVTGLGAMAAGALARPVTPEPSKPPEALTVPQGLTPEALARDERFWATVARQFQVSPDFVNLENGYYGIMPEPVRQAYHRNVDHLNERSSHLLRTTYKPRADEIRDRLAALLGVSGKEIALTRGGTEALQNLIAGYGRLRPGDAVMYADLDYHSGQYAMNWLPARRGVTVERIVIPEPATRQAVLDTYERALSRAPKVRLLLLSHMNNRTGLVTPVRQIVAMARAHGVDVIVDAAHSWGQLDFTLPDLDADFAVFSLHKWMGLPLGSGFLYIREPAPGRHRPPLRRRDLPGLRHPLPRALRHHERGPVPDRGRRPGLPRDPRREGQAGPSALSSATAGYVRRTLSACRSSPRTSPACTAASPRSGYRGRSSKADNLAIAEALMDRHRIFTVARSGMSGGDAVRVTPALFTSADEVDRLAAALRDLLGARTTP